MWNTLPFETAMLINLEKDLGQEKGKTYYTRYTSARDTLITDNFFDNITGSEPNLTDHGAKHIANVLNNVHKLLGDDIDKLSGINLYCLGLIVLFHDVGNINGRIDHNKNISDVYNFVRKKVPKYNREKSIIVKAGEAHCGLSKDGTRDTLKDLDSSDHLDGEKVLLRDLAAILRFADELAEGPQRTSQFMMERHKYDENSQIYHQYASITHIFIDRELGRISLTYEIDLDLDEIDKIKFLELLEFTFKRIIKIDEERRYTKHYCNLLIPFKMTSVKYNFYINGSSANLEIDKLEITDRFPIPGEKEITFNDFMKNGNDISIDPNNLWEQMISLKQKNSVE
ncbi:HD domain-containing protein [Kordia sp.]|uniref:HD domain-containing protein n=1 Tax=Kordia sp. TaxID=1965332 RepID=UPI003D29872B